jgi:hypothetical protein
LEDIEMANGTSVAGTWAYRSYINTSDQPVFGAGLFTFQTPTATTLTGTFDTKTLQGQTLKAKTPFDRPPSKGLPEPDRAAHHALHLV